MLERIGTAGHFAGYDVLTLADAVIATDAAWPRRFPVPDHGTAIGDLAARPSFRLGWGRFADGAEVLYLYDADDGGFGRRTRRRRQSPPRSASLTETAIFANIIIESACIAVVSSCAGGK